MPTILFVCTGNLYRSPIAAEAFHDQLMQANQDEEWIVKSAGTWATPGQEPPPDAVDLALAHGLLIDEHKAQALNADLLAESDLILVMEESHRDSIKAEFSFARKRVHLLSQVVEGIVYDIPDPAQANGNAGAIIGELVELVRVGYSKIYRLAEADRRV